MTRGFFDALNRQDSEAESCRFLYFLFFLKPPQEAPKPLLDLGGGTLKFAGIPRIVHITRSVGIVQQQRNLPHRVAAELPQQDLSVSLGHGNYVIVPSIIRPHGLPRVLSRAGNAAPVQKPPHRRIDRPAVFLIRNARRGDLKAVVDPALLHHIAQQKLRHRTSANIPRTDK